MSQSTNPKTNVLKGSCGCGSVSFSLEGKPLFSVYCHCTKCQRADGAVFVSSMHFPPSALSWTHAAAHAPLQEKTQSYVLFRCKSCHSCAATQMADSQNWAIRGTQLERDADGKIINWEEVKPTSHIFYGTRIVDVADSLPKWEGFPRNSVRLG